jgi:peptidoglycan/xylan/chitin deacetylase (PgdA/CDA1 family)
MAERSPSIWSNPRVPFQLASRRKRLEPPGGKAIMVNLAINVEYWPFDRPMPRGVLPPPHGAQIEPPDIPNYSWVEYGMRCGMPRFMEAVARRGIKASALMNAQVADVYPALMDEIVAAGWELVGHGWLQQSLKQADDEVAVIRRSLARLEQADGRKVRAWLGPGLGETHDTVDHLKASGIEFLHDWVIDDLPFWIRTRHGPMVGLPYALELNDVPVYAIRNASTDELLKRLEATLAVFEREAEQHPRVLTLGLHPHIIGVPHVAHYFEKALDLLMGRPDTVFMTSSQIGDWFVAADGTGGAEVESYTDRLPPLPG